MTQISQAGGNYNTSLLVRLPGHRIQISNFAIARGTKKDVIEQAGLIGKESI